MGLFTNLLLGNGTLKPKLRAALESEGVVLLEEGLPGTITYAHFKAPGRRHNGKVVGECIGLGVSEQRLALYCRSGRVKLIDQPFSEPRLAPSTYRWSPRTGLRCASTSTAPRFPRSRVR